MITFKHFITEESYSDYVDRLTLLLNIKQIGSGAYSSIFQHPKYKQIVVKVFDYDPAYESYLAWCQKNQNNKYVPKIVGVKNIRDKDTASGKHTIVFFEKLTRCTREEYFKFSDRVIRLLDDDAYSQIEDISDCHYDEWKQIAKSSDKDLAAFAKFMVKSVDEYGVDLNPNNVMKRGNQIVIIDPLAE